MSLYSVNADVYLRKISCLFSYIHHSVAYQHITHELVQVIFRAIAGLSLCKHRVLRQIQAENVGQPPIGEVSYPKRGH